VGQGWDVEHLPLPRRECALPVILSTEEEEEEEEERLVSHGRTLHAWP